MSYHFDTIIQRNPDSQIAIDTTAMYGYWERHDGSEGGGLWFDRAADGTLSLTDYDGAGVLPRQVVSLLHAHGYIPAAELALY
jgi:hypothetical protein